MTNHLSCAWSHGNAALGSPNRRIFGATPLIVDNFLAGIVRVWSGEYTNTKAIAEHPCHPLYAAYVTARREARLLL